jgi:uncharacterized repeat protein (TIGR01451 family)
MAKDMPYTELFGTLGEELLSSGLGIRFQARGDSMRPTIDDGDILRVEPVAPGDLKKGDIVLFNDGTAYRAHRIVAVDLGRDVVVTRGDAGSENDATLRMGQIRGRVAGKEAHEGDIGYVPLCGKRGRWPLLSYRLRRTLSRTLIDSGMKRAIRRWARLASSPGIHLVGLFAAIFLFSSSGFGQVAFDTATSTGIRVTGATPTVSFTHSTTTGGTNRLLVVGVSIAIGSSNNAAVTGITYNGVALTRAGFDADNNSTERVEMWYLVAPSTGNHTVSITLTNPGGPTIGVAAGAVTFTGADQNSPLKPFLSADGEAGTFASLDVPSDVNGYIVDTLAISGNLTDTAGPSETQRWTKNSNTNATTDVRGAGSTRPGAPSVPISETFSGTSNWALGALAINAFQADLSVSAAGSSAFFPQNLSYTLTVTNNGTSPATGTVLTDTLAAGLTLVSATPSQGSCTTGPISCSLGTIAVGATATVTVVVTPGAVGGYANTASVTATTPDLDSGNNTAISVAFSQTNACSNPSKNGAGGTLTGVVNTYYPATASAAAGGKSITLGTAIGASTPIAIGDLLLVMQMQDAAINSTNSSSYGDGDSGSGFTNPNSSGLFEFVTATNAVAVTGGTLNLTATGAGGGLIFSYTNAAATGTQGQRKFQVIRVPQYSTATLSSGLTASAWNGSSGGVLALDIAGALNLGSATVSVDGLGFRGGAGLQLSGGTGADTDYRNTAPTAYTGALVAGQHGSKAEGVAGTPRWVESGGTFLSTGVEGYPNGSMARGAPGNAGGGGTDGDPSANDENAGAGGGGNGGAGGFGGDSWSSNLSDGGLGGSAFPASTVRVVMGGGGGSGSRNNSDGDNQASAGSAGGGIIIIRASSMTGTATLRANGSAAYNGTANDAGGGGGAAGSILVTSALGGEGGLTLAANGGRGGDAWDSQAYSLGDRHGPGGGGGGGVVLSTGTPLSISVNGGTNGTTLNPGVAYGATPGTSGVSVTNISALSLSGAQSGAACTSDVTIAKSHTGSFSRGATGTYSVVVSNVSPSMLTSGTVTVTDTLPTGLTPTAASGTGWSCTVAAPTVTCTRADALGVGASYPTITVTVSVSQTAANQVTNTGMVAGGGELNLANDTASDLTNIVSSSDVSITKTGSPNPVKEGATLTYTLTITNSGPTNATNVTVTDVLPISSVSYISATPSQGSCSQASGTVTCALGTLASSGTATVAIAVTALAPSSVNNTATVTADQPDPNNANNSSTQTEIVTFPTSVKLESFTASGGVGQVVLDWKTGSESRNLGFNVYREVNGQRVLLNPSLIAGAALTFRAASPQHTARSYSWMDASGPSGAQYWLEDVELDGTRSMHGPVSAHSRAAALPVTPSLTLAEVNRQILSMPFKTAASRVLQPELPQPGERKQRRELQFQIAAGAAVKIEVDHEGWYRITQPQLVAAGLKATVDPRLLQLFAQGIEQSIVVTGADNGIFGPQAAIEFYGTGINSQYSDQRIYWLLAGRTPGKRIITWNPGEGDGNRPQNFSETVGLQQKTTYFAALLKPSDNFFGALVSTAPVDQILTLADIASSATGQAEVEVVLQGVTDGSHDVSVSLNGSNLGSIAFNSQDEGDSSWPVPLSSLQAGQNTVTLTAQGGAEDTSLVNYIRIRYPHTYTAESDYLRFTAASGDHVLVSGFQNTPTHLIDVSNEYQPVELSFQVEAGDGGYVLDARIPWSGPPTHTLLALADDQFATAAGLVGNVPSTWHKPQAGADVAMISYADFIPQLNPLVQLRRSQGKSVAVIDIQDLYDEFNFGERNPDSIKEFLRAATTGWQKKPRYLLLVGDASLDPRNYLGFGFFDFVPTQIIPTSELKTASDDWFSDFDDSGYARIPTGRLPVRTSDDASTVVGKIVAYENKQNAGTWASQALMVADVDDPTLSFTQESETVQSLLPPTMTTTDVFATGLDPATARQDVLNGINRGNLLVNYNGHGSIEVWSGEDLLDDTTAAALTNGDKLPLFVIMNCLNGFFQDVYTQSMAESLLLAKNGGAAAVWASSSLTEAGPQFQMNQVLVQTLFGQSPPALGDAIAVAKSSITDTEVRRTFILFGDPLMRLKVATSKASVPNPKK